MPRVGVRVHVRWWTSKSGVNSTKLSINLNGVEVQCVTRQRSRDSGRDGARYLSRLPVPENEFACLPAFPKRVDGFGIAPVVEFVELPVRQLDAEVNRTDAYRASAR